MSLRLVVVLFAFSYLLVGCGSPKTPAEFRAMAKDSRFVSAETHMVSRSMSQVYQSWKNRGDACLNLAHYSVYSSGFFGTGSNKVETGRSKPTLIRHKNKLEFYYQEKYKNDLGNPTDDGHYLLVADALPVSSRKTKVIIYFANVNNSSKHVRNALLAWAKGKVRGCPDMGSDI